MIVFLYGRQLSKFNTLQERKTTHIFLIVAKRFRGCRCESNRPALKWRVIWKYAYNPFNTDETLCLGLKYSRIWSLLHGIRNYLQSYKPFLGNIKCGFLPPAFLWTSALPSIKDETLTLFLLVFFLHNSKSIGLRLLKFSDFSYIPKALPFGIKPGFHTNYLSPQVHCLNNCFFL